MVLLFLTQKGWRASLRFDETNSPLCCAFYYISYNSTYVKVIVNSKHLKTNNFATMGGSESPTFKSDFSHT